MFCHRDTEYQRHNSVFSYHFLNKDISINILNNAMEFCMALLHTNSEGRVSQIFYLGLSF